MTPVTTPAHERTLALAGIFQAAVLIKQLAWHGRVDEAHFATSIQSLLKIDALDVPDVYGEPAAVDMGLNAIIQLFTHNRAPKDAEIARYVLSLLHLERKLTNHPKMVMLLRAGIERATNQANHFSTTHENVMANLASLYTDTLSTFSFRIHVTGEPVYLNQTHIMNKVRALLLAGIRSAVLWRQLKGRRWHLLISRLSIIESAKTWLTVKERVHPL